MAFIVVLLSFPLIAYSQSTLNFPRAFTPAELASTGFAVVNPGTAGAAVTFTLYGASGSVVSTSSQPIPAAGQLARVGTELFPTASQSGWVQVTSTTSGLQGFWVGGDFATFTDGADSAPASNDLVLPLVTTNTEVNIANTSSGVNNVTIRLFGEGGTELATAATRSIVTNGVFQSPASALFPGTNLDNARYIRVTGGTGLAGTAVISGFLVSETGVTNAVAAAGAGNEAHFPHVVSGVGGGGNYTTVVGITNLASSAQNVTITFTPESGGSPSTVTRTIQANGALRDTALNLFGFSGGFQNGWVRVAGTASLTAFVAYADSVAGGFAVVPVQSAPRTALLFAHIADLPPWYSGLALLNTTGSNATVSVYAMNPSGTLVGGADDVPTARFQLNAGTKTAKLLSELIPQTQARLGDGGFIFISSTQPLYGIELFFLRNLRVLANVAAGTATGFTPPAGSAPLSLTSISPGRAARGETLTLNGTGFSTTPGSNAVVFAASSGTLPATATTASANSMTVPVPQGAISGPVRVQTGGQTSEHRILEVLASATSLLPPTAVTVTAAATTSDVDIYVPPPAGALNLEAVGVGTPGTPITYAPLSAEISRGETKQLLLVGSGMNSGAGTTVSISGGGISFSNLVYHSSGAIFVNIAVAAGAATGFRNVAVTNSNLDTSVLSGGLLIR